MGANIENLDSAACHQQAENCRVLAEKAMTPAHQIMLEHIADTWLRIAADIKARKKASMGKPSKKSSAQKERGSLV